MAESAVSSTVNLLGKVLLEEGKYLWGAEDKVKELQEELLWMRSFLRKADSIQYEDDIVWMWVCQVQKYVYEAEDVIDKFVIKVVTSRSQNGWRNKMKRYSCIFREFYDLHQAASSIDALKVKISTLSPKLEKYGLIRTFGVNKDRVEELRTEQLEQIQKNVHLEKKKITGLEKNTQEIIEALTRKTPDKGFHAIYGMGGCGKTTLATNVWQHDEVKQHFPGGQAFVYVSKQFKVENVLRDVLRSLRSGTSFDKLSRSELNTKLREVLMTKCLVVLDDVWTKQAWDSLKTAFISCGGDSESKLLLTTRKEEVARYVDDKALEKPDLLNEIESLELLQESMGLELKESLACEHDQNDTVGNYTATSEKAELVTKMLKVCKGLPLAIVVLGGILRKKQSVAEWKSVLDNISSHLVTGYDHGRSCMEILLQSYDDLPYHLKPCFLHLAIFPEDYKIYTKDLYWMWVGEGLVTMSARGDAGRSKSMEDVANDYLRDLAEASLVQVVETSEGWIKSFRLHDLVRDVCIEKASADNLVKTFDFRHDQPQISTTSSSDNYYYNDKMLLRVGIAFSVTSEHSLMQDCIISNAKHLKCIRSLVFILEGNVLPSDEGGDCEKLMRCVCSEYQVLRVLVLARLSDGLKGRLSSKIGKLVHLRYLSLSTTRVTELPSSIGKLRFLEILDLQVWSQRLIIPNTLWELFRLRHLLLPESNYGIKGGGRLRVHTLICLESILNLQLSNLRTEDLSKIKNLRELSIKDKVSKESANDILSFLKTSSRLRICTFKRVEGEVISENPELLSFIVCKCELHIMGEIILQENINFSFPPYLRKVGLYKCELKDDPMGILGSLSHLQTLCLSDECYVGTKMSCSSSSFPLLIELEIEGLKNLKVWEAENGFMPKLEKLTIRGCKELCRIPYVLPSSLDYFWLSDISDGRISEDIESGAQIASPYDSGKLLKDAVLFEQDKPVVVILGKAGAGKATYVMNHLLGSKDVNTSFDVVVRTWVPKRRRRLSSSSSSSSSCLLPRRNIEQLLRDLSNSTSKVELNRMSLEELTAEIQQVMRHRKCLVILLNLELEVDVDVNLDADLDKTFGHRHPGYAEMGSKLVITSPYNASDDDAATLSLMHADYHLVILGPPTPLHTWKILRSDKSIRNSGLKWNWMRHHSSNPLLTAMFEELVMNKENLIEWESEHNKLLSDANPMDFSQVFRMCYDDLPLHLRRCLIYLASFPYGVDVSTKKLFQMWIASGILEAEQDDVESLQKVASSCLNELVQRGMVTVEKNGRDKRAKTCQLKFALRDMCSTKAKEDHNLAVHLDQMSVTPVASIIEQLMSSLECNTCPTSLMLFPDVISPLRSEESWEWLLYICKHFELLRVLDVQGMWMTKGSLPMEVGELKHLRYLSLRATWVTELPSSLANLINLQTLDLRVMERLVIPDVLWKLEYLVHLYLPQDFEPQQTSKLQLSGLNCLQTLVNLDTDMVILKDLLELKLLKILLVRKIHARDEDELADILVQLSTSLELCIGSQIINDDQTILARKFHFLKKLKIKGTISIELKPEIFPSQLEDLTLKHTRLEDDPLAVLEKLPKLGRLFLDHESLLSKELKISRDFFESVNLILCSLCNLETLYTPKSRTIALRKISIINCWRLTVKGEEKDHDLRFLRTGNWYRLQ